MSRSFGCDGKELEEADDASCCVHAPIFRRWNHTVSCWLPRFERMLHGNVEYLEKVTTVVLWDWNSQD
jgi:hypothetical protein